MTIEALISQYAKEAKCSKAKLQAFAEAVIALQPKSCSNAGRKASDESIRLRNALKATCQEMKGKQFTVKELAQKLNAEPVYINNNLSYLVKHRELSAKVVGKLKGNRGKPQSVWTVE